MIKANAVRIGFVCGNLAEECSLKIRGRIFIPSLVRGCFLHLEKVNLAANLTDVLPYFYRNL